MSYCKIADVVDTLLENNWKGAFLAKVDLKDAFRMVPIHREDWGYLGLKVDNYYFINSVLPMGCGTSCAIFQKLTRALCWIASKELPELRIFGYLDDFLLVSKDLKSAKLHLAHFIAMCKELGVPISEEKTMGPSQSLVFLGVGLDSVNSTLYLDDSKKAKYISVIDSFVGKERSTRKQWQSLVGTLAFVSQVVQPGRTFMVRISNKMKGRARMIKSPMYIKKDLLAWKHFIENDMAKPFKMFDSKIVPSVHWYTDASGSLGFGAIFGHRWLYGEWEDSWWREQNIMLLELYPIWLALKVWGPLITNYCLLVHTDNQALVAALQKCTTKLLMANALLRDISIDCMRLNIILHAAHISGVDNIKADLLSRLQVKEFLQIAGTEVDRIPTVCPNHLHPKNCKDMLTSFCE